MKIADININNEIVSKVYMYNSNNFFNNINITIDRYSSTFIITQNNIADNIMNNINSEYSKKVKKFIFSNDNNYKSEKHLKKLLKFLIKNKCNKNSLIISVGGGFVSDIAGFAASIYMRGIHHIIIPTTLLSMVDAAIGGKTAIDFKNIRNIIGTFNHPQKILIYPNFLLTLPEDEKINGFAEIIKYALIADKSLFEFLENNQSEIFSFSKSINHLLEDVIIKCIKHKISIIEKDEYDNNLRQILNFGHTTGHALESYFDFAISHGIGVLYGMKVATKISLDLNNINIDTYNRITNLIEQFQIDKLRKINVDKIIDIMYYDKKSLDNKINFIILNSLGSASIEKNIDLRVIKKGLSIL